MVVVVVVVYSLLRFIFYEMWSFESDNSSNKLATSFEFQHTPSVPVVPLYLVIDGRWTSSPGSPQIASHVVHNNESVCPSFGIWALGVSRTVHHLETDVRTKGVSIVCNREGIDNLVIYQVYFPYTLGFSMPWSIYLSREPAYLFIFLSFHVAESRTTSAMLALSTL